jgi:lysozyme family protein
MSNRLEQFLNKTILIEGGFQKNKNDKGNWTKGRVGHGLLLGTKWGITAMMFPDLDIENLTKEEALDLYLHHPKLKWIWNPYYDKMANTKLAFLLFDMGINMGNGAVKVFQKHLNLVGHAGLVVDGDFGSKTYTAYKENFMLGKDFKLLLNSYRVRYGEIVANHNSQVVFLKGWLNRVDYHDEGVSFEENN